MKKFKNLIILAMCMMFTVLSTPLVHASEEVGTPIGISPFYINISGTSTVLSNASGKASCTATISAYSSSNLKVFMYLEKYVGGSWTPYASWSSEKTGNSLTLQKTQSVASGTYRLKASYYAGSENTVKYSASKTF